MGNPSPGSLAPWLLLPALSRPSRHTHPKPSVRILYQVADCIYYSDIHAFCGFLTE